MSLARYVLIGMVASTSARADTLIEAARKAVSEARYCDARDDYVALAKRDGDAKFIYNAAESAFAADDRVAALSLYQQLLAEAPAFERAKAAKKRVGELGKIIAKEGVGRPCRARVARCGDSIVDAPETCDDGANGIDGDGCDAGCVASACGNGVIAPPETCDDGNVVDGDGCSGVCAVVVVVVAPPPPPPPAVAAATNWPAIGATAAGGAAAVVGGVVAVVGALPWLAMNQQQERLVQIRSDFADAGPSVQAALLRESVDVNQTAQIERAAWNDGGQWLFIGGVAGVSVGLAATAAGVSWWLLGE